MNKPQVIEDRNVAVEQQYGGTIESHNLRRELAVTKYLDERRDVPTVTRTFGQKLDQTHEERESEYKLKAQNWESRAIRSKISLFYRLNGGIDNAVGEEFMKVVGQTNISRSNIDYRGLDNTDVAIFLSQYGYKAVEGAKRLEHLGFKIRLTASEDIRKNTIKALEFFANLDPDHYAQVLEQLNDYDLIEPGRIGTDVLVNFGHYQTIPSEDLEQWKIIFSRGFLSEDDKKSLGNLKRADILSNGIAFQTSELSEPPCTLHRLLNPSPWTDLNLLLEEALLAYPDSFMKVINGSKEGNFNKNLPYFRDSPYLRLYAGLAEEGLRAGKFKEVGKFASDLFQTLNLKIEPNEFDVKLSQIVLNSPLIQSLNSMESAFWRTATELTITQYPELLGKFLDQKEQYDPSKEGILIKELIESVIKDTNINSDGNVATFLNDLSSWSERLKRQGLSKIVASFVIGRERGRSDIETITSQLESANLRPDDPANQMFTDYIVDQLPYGNAGLINSIRRQAVEVEKAGRFKLGWIHEAVHNYPTSLNVDLLEAYVDFIDTGNITRLKELSDQIDPHAKPNIGSFDRIILGGTRDRVAALAADLRKLYYPDTKDLSKVLMTVRENLPSFLFDEISESLKKLESLDSEETDSIDVAIKLGKTRINLVDYIKSRPHAKEVVTLNRIDLLLRQTSCLIFPEATQKLSKKLESRELQPQDVQDTGLLLESMVDFLTASSVKLPNEKQIRSLIISSTDYYINTPNASHLSNFALNLTMHGYQQVWQNINQALITDVVPQVAQMANIPSDQAKDKALHFGSVDMYKTSPLFPIELSIKQLGVTLSNVNQRLKSGDLQLARTGDVLKAEYQKGGNLQPVPENIDIFLNQTLGLDKLEQVFAGDSLVEIDRSLMSISKSSFAKAYRLLRAVNGEKTVLDLAALQNQGIYVKIINGIPLLVIVEDGKLLNDPYSVLNEKYHPVKALTDAINIDGD